MNTNRVTLTQLADHLENGQCIHEYFNFGNWNGGTIYENSKINGCGTNGCAIGELPALDSNWSFFSSGVLVFKNDVFTNDTLSDYFDITIDAVNHLFFPQYQRPSIYGGKTLKNSATKAEVIHNIREFVRITGKN